MGTMSTVDFGRGKCALVYNHIPKCAGNTVVDAVTRRIPGGFFIRTAWEYGELLDQAPAMLERDNAILVHGHGVWGVHDYLPDDVRCFYFTWLREPFRQAVSAVNYSIANYFYTEREFADRLRGFRNFQTDFLADGDLDLAIDRLENRYLMAGFVEHFDDSLKMLFDKLGMAVPDFQIRNVTGRNHGKDLTPTEEFLENNQKDYALYNWALERFGPRPASVQVATEVRHNVQYHPQSERIVEDLKNADNARVAEGLRRLIETEPDHPLMPGRMYALSSVVGTDDRKEGVRLYREACKVMAANIMRKPAFALTPEELGELTRMALGRLPDLESRERDSVLNRSRQYLLRELAEIAGKTGEPDEAERLYRQAVAANPGDRGTVRACAAMLRGRGKADEAFALLLALPPSIRNETGCMLELIVTLYAARGIAAVREFLTEHPDFAKPLETRPTSPGPVTEIPLEDFDPGKRLLLLRSAPEIVCDDALETLAGRWPNLEMDGLLQEGCTLNEAHRLSNVDRMQPGLFNADAVFATLGETLAQRSYDTILVPVNGQLPPERYANFTDFARRIGCDKVYGYSLFNVFFDNSQKRLLIL